MQEWVQVRCALSVHDKHVSVKSAVTSCDVTNCATTLQGFNKHFPICFSPFFLFFTCVSFLFCSLHSGMSKVTRITVGRDIHQPTNQCFRASHGGSSLIQVFCCSSCVIHQPHRQEATQLVGTRVNRKVSKLPSRALPLTCPNVKKLKKTKMKIKTIKKRQETLENKQRRKTRKNENFF